MFAIEYKAEVLAFIKLYVQDKWLETKRLLGVY